EGDRRIVQPAAAPQWRAQQQHWLQLAGVRAEPRDARRNRIQQGVLQEQVINGTGREVEFGKDKQVDTRGIGLAGKRQGLLNVETDVASGTPWTCHGSAHKAMAVERSEGALHEGALHEGALHERMAKKELAETLAVVLIYSISVIILTAASNAAI